MGRPGSELTANAAKALLEIPGLRDYSGEAQATNVVKCDATGREAQLLESSFGETAVTVVRFGPWRKHEYTKDYTFPADLVREVSHYLATGKMPSEGLRHIPTR